MKPEIRKIAKPLTYFASLQSKLTSFFMVSLRKTDEIHLTGTVHKLINVLTFFIFVFLHPF